MGAAGGGAPAGRDAGQRQEHVVQGRLAQGPPLDRDRGVLEVSEDPRVIEAYIGVGHG